MSIHLLYWSLERIYRNDEKVEQEMSHKTICECDRE